MCERHQKQGEEMATNQKDCWKKEELAGFSSINPNDA
jgi:hypothetical protein